MNRLDGGVVDGSMSPPPGAPIVSGLATPVPWPLATIRGVANGAHRVIVEGGANPLASAVLPDGTFCIDVPMPSPGAYDFSVSSQGLDGQFAEMRAAASVVFDPNAPPLNGITTCSGADPRGCAGAVEICENGRDDDCNGLRDAADPACSTCEDDIFEPNDDLTAPRLDPGRYDSLSLCAGTVDYYGIYASSGETIEVRALFVHATGNLDLQLYAPDRTTVLAETTSVTDDELLRFEATTTGEHKVRVAAPGAENMEYVLVITVIPAAG